MKHLLIIGGQEKRKICGKKVLPVEKPVENRDPLRRCVFEGLVRMYPLVSILYRCEKTL